MKIKLSELDKRQRYFDIFTATALLVFGVYHTIRYFGHQLVPISDFPLFVKTGHLLLSLKLPEDFKRVPVLGLLQASLSYLVKSPHADLTAGWLLNSILYPLNIILLWLVGRKIIGKAALPLAIIAAINPWVVYMQTEPIAETALLFFMLLTFYFILRGSRWSYFFASITMMVRYEGAALILAALVTDIIQNKQAKERIKAIVYSSLAAMPLVLWMLGTLLKWRSQGMAHYLNVFTTDYENLFGEPLAERTGIIRHMKLLWQMGFRPLLMPYPNAGAGFVNALMLINKIIATASFFFGCGYGLYKRQWKIPALLCFFLPYFLLHARYPYPLHRYHIMTFWIALFICFYGLESGWNIIAGRYPIPRPVISGLLAVVTLSAFFWSFSLMPYLPRIAMRSPVSAHVPYAAMILVLVLFVGRIFILNTTLLRNFSVLMLSSLLIVSNQFVLVQVVGNGQRDREFKLLAEWYSANAGGEKMSCYMFETLGIFAPQYKDCFVGIPIAQSYQEFLQKCYDSKITYIVWASREMFNQDTENYKMNRLDNIAMLNKTQDVEPFQFITQITTHEGWINVFKLCGNDQEGSLKQNHELSYTTYSGGTK
ncbi:MAG: hypothetical protein ABIG61_01290 [Planctomycetota bacterium]